MSKRKNKEVEEFYSHGFDKQVFWQDMWITDKRSMVETMLRNIAADIAAGYNPVGDCIKRQREELRKYEEQFDRELMALADMTEEKAERWCKYDLIRRGAVEI